MRNIFVGIINYTNKGLSWLGFRSQRHWGVVYDSVTKQPVDPVVVKLINSRNGNVIGSSIVNMAGEYGFMVGPGSYKLFAYRANFEFPSKQITTPDDGVYKNVYTGQGIEVAGEPDVLSLNIPLDPTSHDWNQQDKLKVVKVRPRLERVYQVVAQVFFWFLFIVATVEYFLITGDFDVFWEITFFAMAGIILLSWITPRVRLWGRVVSKATGKPVSEAKVLVTHPKLTDVVIAHATTTLEGKFFVRLAKGEYRVAVEAPELPPFSKVISVGKEGLLNTEFYI